MKIVIMAGGKGTRIASIKADVPKPMIRILNKPILEYQIEVLSKQGFKDIILVVGHLGEVIKQYFGDGSGISPATGKPFGVKIQYFTEEEPLGTAGALYLIREQLNEPFLLINGDIIFDIDIKKFYQYHQKKKGLVTLLTHPNSHPYDSGIILTNNNGQVINWLHKEEKREWYKNRVNAGIHLFSPDIWLNNTICQIFEEKKKVDLDRDILKKLVKTGELYAYDSPEYVKDMGTPDRYYSVTEDIALGKIEAKNLGNKQKAVFLDRDGTINKYVGFLKDIDDFELLPGVAEAIRQINKSGYLAIVVTNQPVIARGDVTVSELELIHNKMETLLGNEGAYLDAIYYCPHHPDKGFEGEIPELKIKCTCRKPEPGMILKAAKDFNIDLEKSWVVGDSKNDILAGKHAGCHTAFIGQCGDQEAQEQYTTVLEFVKKNIK